MKALKLKSVRMDERAIKEAKKSVKKRIFRSENEAYNTAIKKYFKIK